MVVGEGFEPSKAEPADLQSAPVDRLGTPPYEEWHYKSFRLTVNSMRIFSTLLFIYLLLNQIKYLVNIKIYLSFYNYFTRLFKK